MPDAVAIAAPFSSPHPAHPKTSVTPVLPAQTAASHPARHTRPSFALPGISSNWTVFGAYFALALAFRITLIGNPIIHVDEEFYLYVADRWAHGALPFVDVWDRKPIGLFLLYRLFLLFPGDGVIAYQIGAIASTAATALIIHRLARMIAPPAAALQAGAAYVLFLPVFNCGMGQAPVFYNLPMALAVLGLVDVCRRPGVTDVPLRGAAIMALVGVAMQIKYSVVFEGVAFGLMLLARGWADAWAWRKLATSAALWIGCALAPTALVLAAYAAMGHAEAFVQANFLSILLRGPEGAVTWFRLAKEMAVLIPFWLAIFFAPRRMAMPTGPTPDALRVLQAWGLAAMAGFLLFGTWYDHYAGPLLAPLSVLAAPALARSRDNEKWIGRLLLGFGAVAGLVVMVYQERKHGSADEVATMSALIRQELQGRCFYQFDGEPVLYRAVGACVPTRYAFPNHLNTYTEAPALGVNADVEVARIMLSHPGVVIIGEWRKIYLPNHVSRAIVQDFLARDYDRYASFTLGSRTYGLYRLKPRTAAAVAIPPPLPPFSQAPSS